jgi:aspartate/methionine/tyrosine aminotransferase
VWLVVDNTYEHFDVEGRNRLPDGSGGDHDRRGRSWPDFPCFDEEHVINIFSFSKGYAMAGFRVGYVALSSKNGNDNNDGNGGRGTRAYEEMLKVQDTIAICTSRISQMAALGAMRSGRDWVYDRVRTLDAGRAAILGAMSSLEDVIGGNGAMYVMGKLPDGVDDQVSEFWAENRPFVLGAKCLVCIISPIILLHDMHVVICSSRNSRARW